MNRKSFNILVILICVYLVFSNIHFRVGNFLSFDIFGYYLYLPLQFIYGDLGVTNEQIFTEVVQKNLEPFGFYQGHRTENGNMVMKYTMGQSLLYAPFFCVGHVISWFTDHPSDGFSKPYAYSVFAGGIFYTLLGIYFFSKILRHFFSQKISFFVLVLVVFGTNYLLSNTMYFQNGMTHNTLFTCYTVLIWLTIQWHENQKWKTLLLLAIVCGITILIRPTEMVCLLIPLLWKTGNKEHIRHKIQLFKTKRIQIITFSLLILCITSVQLIYFKKMTGSFFYTDYAGNAGEGLDLMAPYTWEVLFSFRKGWLIYTPIMLFSLLGFIVLYQRNRSLFWPIFIYFLVNLWFVSSWTCWWYAFTFGQRALIPSYVALSIPLGYFLVALSESVAWKKIVATVFILFFFGLNLFQMVQYHHGILPGDRVTAGFYFKVFGRMERKGEWDQLLLPDREAIRAKRFIDTTHYSYKGKFGQNFEKLADHFSTFSHSGKKAELLTKDHPFSSNAHKSYQDLTQEEYAWLQVSAYVFPQKEIAETEFHLVAFMDHQGKPYLYETLNSKTLQLQKGKWNKLTFNYFVPPVRRKFNDFKTYVWLQNGDSLLVDDLTVKVYPQQKLQ